MQIWELHEKYEDSLLEHTTFETDDKMEEYIHVDQPKKTKKKSNKKKKESQIIHLYN